MEGHPQKSWSGQRVVFSPGLRQKAAVWSSPVAAQSLWQGRVIPVRSGPALSRGTVISNASP